MKTKLTILSLAMAPTLAMAGTAISGPIQTDTCTLLQDNLTVSLSSGVVGGYDCDTTNGKINIAACHTAGRVTSRNSVTNIPAGCGTTANTAACSTTTTNISGPVIPRASTAGGTMQTYFPGTGTCAQAAANSAATF
ncbi:MAG: hypothetical protein H6R18_2652 [Proteobacteria bacterium]|nr:hypothetical protein [Pseudomonadota bacterium]